MSAVFSFNNCQPSTVATAAVATRLAFAASSLGASVGLITTVALGVLRACCFQTVGGIAIASLMPKTLILAVVCGGAAALLFLPTLVLNFRGTP